LGPTSAAPSASRPATAARREGQGLSPLLIFGAGRFLLVVVVLCGVTATYVVLAAGYLRRGAARALGQLYEHQIYDRNGHLLYEIPDQRGGASWCPFEQRSSHLINATVATEDERWQHPGVDPVSVLRAVIWHPGAGYRVRG
jgi:membrane peptidoglycan carboxypeptidase